MPIVRDDFKYIEDKQIKLKTDIAVTMNATQREGSNGRKYFIVRFGEPDPVTQYSFDIASCEEARDFFDRLATVLKAEKDAL